jgi:hypothetical protein
LFGTAAKRVAIAGASKQIRENVGDFFGSDNSRKLHYGSCLDHQIDDCVKVVSVRSGYDRRARRRWFEHVVTTFIDDAAADKNNVSQ